MKSAGPLLRRLSRWRFPLALLVLAVFAGLFFLPAAAGITLRKTVFSSQFSDNIAFFSQTILVGGLLILLLTLAFGRWYCAVLCPAGTVQDIFSKLGRRFGLSRLRNAKPPFAINIVAMLLAALFAGVVILDPLALFGWLFLPAGAAANSGMWGVERLYSSLPGALALWVIVLALLAGVPLLFGRVYCDVVCPVGTLLRLTAKLPGKRIAIAGDACVSCGRCEGVCPARCADAKGKSIAGDRCLLCLDCVAVCPAAAIVYTSATPAGGRRGFLGGVGLAVLAAGFAAAREVKARLGLERVDRAEAAPPGAGGLLRHAALCIGCQACVLSCPVGIIRADALDNRPRLDYRFGYCQYNCLDCVGACPAKVFDAISLEEKQRTRLARVELRRERCVVKTRGEECGACAEVCPTHAVTMILEEEGKPTIPDFQAEYCIGCGGCYHVCPVEPRAFTVAGLEVHETAAGVRVTAEPAQTPANDAPADFSNFSNFSDFPF